MVDTVDVRVSAASARQPFHGCEPGYIRDVCRATCCESTTSPTGIIVTIHPVEVAMIRERGGRVVGGMLRPRPGEHRCPFKTDANLCGLHGTDDKPFGCIASPFTLTRRDTLIVRNRYRLLRCYRDDRDGTAPPAYRAFAASMVLLFGRSTATRIRDHLDGGGGDMVVPMRAAAYAMLHDNTAIKGRHK